MGPETQYFVSLAVSPDGRVLACGASDQSCLFDLTAGKVLLVADPQALPA